MHRILQCKHIKFLFNFLTSFIEKYVNPSNIKTTVYKLAPRCKRNPGARESQVQEKPRCIVQYGVLLSSMITLILLNLKDKNSMYTTYHRTDIQM